MTGTGAVDRDEAAVRLADLYLRTRGPATARDLAAWASLTLTEAHAAADGRTAYRRSTTALSTPPDPRRAGAT